VNEIRVSGVLAEVTEHDAPTGKFLTARLRFSKQYEIPLLVAGEKFRMFGPYDAGDAVLVTGRVGMVKGGLAILLDEIGPWKIAVRRPNAMFMRDEPAPHTEESTQ
jgi:hypothetical protein